MPDAEHTAGRANHHRAGLADVLDSAAGPTLTEQLAEAIASTPTVAELVARLRTEPRVIDVEVYDHLIKTEPPITEIRVDFKRTDGTPATVVLDLTLKPDDTVELAGTHHG